MSLSRNCALTVMAAFGIAATAPALMPSNAHAQEAEKPQQSELRFDVMEFVVRGNTVMTPADIQRVLTPFTGLGKAVKDVEQARDALEKAYRDRGFATVVIDIPAQDVRAGIVRLNVVEGRIGRVRVENARYVTPSEVKEALPGLREGAVPNVTELQDQLSQANSRVTRTITPEFRAGDEPGTVDVDLTVKDKRPWGATLELNDQYNRSTERWRVNASAYYDNLWQAGHSASVFYQTSPDDPQQIQAISGSYFMPLGYSRTSLLAYAVSSNTDVATLGGLAVIGDGFNAGLRVIHTLSESSPGIVQSLMFGVDFKDYEDQIGLFDPTTNQTLTFTTPVTYLPFTGQYRLIGGNPSMNYEFSIGTTFAFDGLVGDQDEFGGYYDKDPLTMGQQFVPGKRAGAEASFIYLFGSARYNQTLPWDLSLKTGLDWAVSPKPLISNEQFVLGGLSSVRGYREAEVLGDIGVRLSVEVDRNIPLAWAGKEIAEAVLWQAGVFAEGGGAWLQEPLPDEQDEFYLGSIGLTTSVQLFDVVTWRADLAYQFKDEPGGAGTLVDDDFADMRGHMSVSVKY